MGGARSSAELSADERKEDEWEKDLFGVRELVTKTRDRAVPAHPN